MITIYFEYNMPIESLTYRYFHDPNNNSRPSDIKLRAFIPPLMYIAYELNEVIPNWDMWKQSMREWGFDELGYRFYLEYLEYKTYWESEYSLSIPFSRKSCSLLFPTFLELRNQNLLNVHPNKQAAFNEYEFQVGNGLDFQWNKLPIELHRSYSLYDDEHVTVYSWMYDLLENTVQPSSSVLKKYTFFYDNIIKCGYTYDYPVYTQKVFDAFKKLNFDT